MGWASLVGLHKTLKLLSYNFKAIDLKNTFILMILWIDEGIEVIFYIKLFLQHKIFQNQVCMQNFYPLAQTFLVLMYDKL